MRHWLWMVVLIISVGCSSAPPKPPVHIGGPAMPDSLGAWSQPTALEEDSDVPILPPVRLPPTPFEKVVDYTPGREVAVVVAVGKPFRITLQEGETIYNYVDGDRGVLPEGESTPPWAVTESISGPASQPHLVVTASRPGLSNGLTITTSQRVYEVALRSVAESKIRSLRWEYPPSAMVKQSKPRILPMEPRSYDVGYTWEMSDPAPVWAPTHVVDTGRQTFVILPVNLGAMQAPMVRLLGPTGPELVNGRQFKNILILDHKFNAAELRYGVGEHAETVKIIRQPSRVIQCPGDVACPRWPETAVAGLPR